MSDNITNDSVTTLRMRAMGSESPVPIGSIAPPASPAHDDNSTSHESGGAIDQDTQPAEAAEASTTEIWAPTFVFRVGPSLEQFFIDYHDLRSESLLIRDLTDATGLDLGTVDPDVFVLIHNWFLGHFREVPFDKESRDAYIAAATVAHGLGLTECESQLMVVVHQAEAVLADVLRDEIRTGVRMDVDAVKDHLEQELDVYMSRSRNTGGEDSNFGDFDSAPGHFY